MRGRSARTLLAGAVFHVLVAADGGATELDFVYADRFPPLLGVAGAPIRQVDARSGLETEKTSYAASGGRVRLVTHVVRTHCGAWVEANGEFSTRIVAQQWLPEVIDGPQAADARNHFAAVYARDHDDRIRLYENVTVVELTEITTRLLPVCPAL